MQMQFMAPPMKRQRKGDDTNPFADEPDPKVTRGDADLIQRVFITACDERPIIIENVLRECTPAQLNEMIKQLDSNSKTKNVAKLAAVADNVKHIVEMQQVITRFTATQTQMKQMIAAKLWDMTVSKSGDGIFNPAVLRATIKDIIEKRNEDVDI